MRRLLTILLLVPAMEMFAASEVAFRIPERDLIPESIAYDPADRSFYIGSLYKRKIIRRSADGTIADFIPSGRDGIWQVLGMKVDPVKRELWANVCNIGDDPPMVPPEPKTVGQAAVYRYDLRTSKLIKRYTMATTAPKLCFNDLALLPNGDVYISSGPEWIFRIDAAKDTLEKFESLPSGRFVNGIAAAADGRTLYLASHTEGVVRVDLASRTSEVLPTPAETHLMGTDGLYVHGRTLVAIQNGVKSPRVVQAFLSDDGKSVTKIDVLDREHPLFNVPTCGVTVGNTLYYIANSQLDSFTNLKIWPREKLQDPVILEAALTPTSGGRAAEIEELRQLHRKDRQAHFQTDVPLLMSDSGPEFLYVSRGKIERLTPAAQHQGMSESMTGATYNEWDDLEPPIIRVSDDGSMGWIITRLRVKQTQKMADGKIQERTFVYAGIMTYEKRDGRWTRVANVSTFE